MQLSVLTPVRDRVEHLARLVEGLNRSAGVAELELLVGWMGGEDPRPALDAARGFAARAVPIEGEELPLAGARNQLAAAASAPLLIFLDVDCIPAAGLLAVFRRALRDRDALAIGETLYLPEGADPYGPGADAELFRAARPHPARAGLFPAPGELRIDDSYALFWSLNFAVRRTTFIERIGGFDDSYRGYGIEDTDFARRAARARVPLAWVGGGTAFHQHHPPTRLRPEGVAALVENARRYRERWGEWPAKGWLEELAAAGMVHWDEDADSLDSRPSPTR